MNDTTPTAGSGSERRTEVISDLDYPLDVPSTTDSGSTAGSTAASPSTATYSGSDTSAMSTVDPIAPLPFGDDFSHDAPPARARAGGRGTTDLALFVARAVTGVLLGLLALRTLFGLFGGPGRQETAALFSSAGFSASEALALGVGIGGLVGAVLLVVGLVTPLATAVLLVVVALTTMATLGAGEAAPLIDETQRGLEAPLLYGALLVVLLFAGAGRWSLDRRWSWSHRPRFSGFVWLVLAIAAVVAVYLLLNGGNPLAGTTTEAVPLTG